MNGRMLRGVITVALMFSAVSLTTHLLADDAQDKWDAPPRAAKKKNPVPADAASIEAGKAAYIKQCLPCHGALGKGDGPAAKDLNPKPHDLSAPVVVEQTDGALFFKITEGKKPMPTFETVLTETERWQVINYVRTLSAAAASKP
jgi:mono/diheme cytochrome c family protein